ncbi:MAG: hypothetical protein WCA00_06030 [Candidatus Acidiferrales bacterium]
MAKIKFSLHGIASDIRKAQKKLRALRAKVTEADQKKIDLNLRVLEKSYRLIEMPCPRRIVHAGVPFGQWFTTKGK